MIFKKSKEMRYLIDMMTMAINEDDYDSFRSHFEELRDLFAEIPERF